VARLRVALEKVRVLKALGHAALDLGTRQQRGSRSEPVVVELTDKRRDVAALEVLLEWM
jgi:hypothetical protein